jgi:hypothetical protein
LIILYKNKGRNIMNPASYQSVDLELWNYQQFYLDEIPNPQELPMPTASISTQAKRNVPFGSIEPKPKRVRKTQSHAIKENQAASGLLPWSPKDIKTLVTKMTSTPATRVEDIANGLGRTAQACRNKYQEILFNQRLRDAIDPESRLTCDEISIIKKTPLNQREEEKLIKMFKKGLTLPIIALELKRTQRLCRKKMVQLKLIEPKNGKKSNRLNRKIKNPEVINPVRHVQTQEEAQLDSNSRFQKLCASLIEPKDIFIDTGKLYEDSCYEAFIDHTTFLE